MQSSFLHKLDIWKKKIKKGEPLPAGYAVPQNHFKKHQKKIQKRFSDFCKEHNIILKIYSIPSNKLFNQ